MPNQCIILSLFLSVSGHGFSMDGTEYICPSDARFSNVAATKKTNVSVCEISRILESRASRRDVKKPRSLIIIDACRYDSALQTNAPSAGAVVLQQQGVCIMHSCAPGGISSDGIPGRNGVFTSQLMTTLSDRSSVGRSHEALFKKVRIGVEKATRGQQKPIMVDGVMDDMVLRLNEVMIKARTELCTKADKVDTEGIYQKVARWFRKWFS